MQSVVGTKTEKTLYRMDHGNWMNGARGSREVTRFCLSDRFSTGRGCIWWFVLPDASCEDGPGNLYEVLEILGARNAAIWWTQAMINLRTVWLFNTWIKSGLFWLLALGMSLSSDYMFRETMEKLRHKFLNRHNSPDAHGMITPLVQYTQCPLCALAGIP